MGLCMQCLTLAAVHQICVDADGMKHNAKHRPGLAIPISPAVDAALREADGRAFIFGDPALPDVIDFHMGLDALQWKTALFENSSKHGTEANIINIVHDSRFCTGPMLFVLIGQLVTHGERQFLAPKDVDFSAVSAEDWELELKAKCISFAWIQAQVASVRGTRSKPTIFLFDGRYGRVNSNVGAPKVAASRKVCNSVVLSYSQDKSSDNDGFLSQIQQLIVKANVDLKDVLADLRVRYQDRLQLEHWGLNHDFCFVQDPPSKLTTYPDPKIQVNFIQDFVFPLTCNLPFAAIAGRPSFQPRLVRVAMNPKRVSCVEWILTRFEAMNWRGTCVVHGPSASGKSAIAEEVCYQLVQRRRCAKLFWLRAGDRFQFYYDLLYIARSLGLVAHTEREMDVLMQRVRKWLTFEKGWILVVEDLLSHAALQDLELPLAQGMVVCTSAFAEWTEVHWENIIELSSFRQLEAHAFVLQSLPDEQPALVETLISLLHFQQLPLTLAVAYILSEDITVKGYIDLLQGAKEQQAHTSQQARADSGVDEGTALAVATTMELLEALSAEALKLAVMCACLAPSAIPRSLFQQPGDNDRLDLLVRFALLEPDSGDTFSMHSMLQLALREYAMRSAARRLSADHKPSPVPPLPKACHDVLVLLDAAVEVVPLDNTKRGGLRQGREPWLVHALATREHNGQLSSWLLEACAEEVAMQLQDYEQGLHLLRMLREDVTHDDAKENSYARLASVMVATAKVLMEREDFDEAEVTLSQALQIQQGLVSSEAKTARELVSRWQHEEEGAKQQETELDALKAAAVDEEIRIRRMGGGVKYDGTAERAITEKESKLARARDSALAADEARKQRFLLLGFARRAVAATLRAMGECLQRKGAPARARERFEQALLASRTRIGDFSE